MAVNLSDPTLFIEEYTAPEFVNTFGIEQMHNSPRFGLTNDITALASGNQKEIEDYLLGLSIVSLIIIGLFVIWTLTLLILKCLGRRVGCASGIPPKPPPAPKMPFIVQEATFSLSYSEHEMEMPGNPEVIRKETEEYEERVKNWQREVVKAKNQIFLTRVVFLLSGTAVLAGIGFYLYFGIDSLKLAVDHTQQGVNRINSVIDQAVNVTSSFLNTRDTASDHRTDLINSNENWCPSSTQPQILSLKDNLLGVAAAVASAADSSIVQSVENINQELREVQSNFRQTAMREMRLVQIVFYAGLALAFLQAIVTVVMMAGVAIAWMKGSASPFRCLQTYFMLPFFVLLTGVSIALSVAFVILSTAGADMCYDSPDAKVTGLLNGFEENINPLVLQQANYYVNGCESENVINMPTFVPYVLNATSEVNTFLTRMNTETTELLLQLCGSETSVIMAVMNLLKDVLNNIGTTMVNTAEVFACQNGNGIYTNLAYNTICYEAINGFYGIYFSQLGIALFSMIMITLRVSWHGIKVDELEDRDSIIAERSSTRSMAVSPSMAGKKSMGVNGAGGFMKKKSGFKDLEGHIEMNTVMGEVTKA